MRLRVDQEHQHGSPSERNALLRSLRNPEVLVPPLQQCTCSGSCSSLAINLSWSGLPVHHRRSCLQHLSHPREQASSGGYFRGSVSRVVHSREEQGIRKGVFKNVGVTMLCAVRERLLPLHVIGADLSGEGEKQPSLISATVHESEGFRRAHELVHLRRLGLLFP